MRSEIIKHIEENIEDAFGNSIPIAKETIVKLNKYKPKTFLQQLKSPLRQKGRAKELEVQRAGMEVLTSVPKHC